MNSVKDMVSAGKQVKFLRYQAGELWYVTECGFEFPVPIEDTNGASFAAEDRALYFMRWIKQHIEFIAQAKTE